jgi:hypothetical protein
MSHASLLVALDPLGTGESVEEAVQRQMAPFDENGEWFGEGTRWDWWVIGGQYSGVLCDDNVMRRADVALPVLAARQRERAASHYREHVLSYSGPAEHREFMTGAKCGESEGEFVERWASAPFPTHYAFLRRHCWQERERAGWFGVGAATECEKAGKDMHICTFERDGARIVSWGNSESWDRMFFPRFVEPLPSETLLVTVDYHV